METLYMEDPYLKEFEATVKEVNEGKFIVLDKTAFYPKGGGQIWDEGKLVDENSNEYKVVYVGKFSGQISHEVDKEGLQPGSKIKGVIAWERRYKMMRMHTAAHLISAIIHEKTGALITGGQLGLDKSKIDFSLEDFDKEKMNSFVEEANRIIKEGREVKWYFLTREEVLNMPNATKLAASDHIPEGEKLRIVEIDGIDKQMDGGTHVKNLQEIGSINIMGTDNKGKNRRRLYYTVE